MENSDHHESRDVFVRVSTGRVEDENKPLAASMLSMPLDVKVMEWLSLSNADAAWISSILMPLLTQGKVRLQLETHYEVVEMLSHMPFDYPVAEQLLENYLATAGLTSVVTPEAPEAPASTDEILPPEEVFVTSRTHGALLRAVTDGRLATLSILIQEESAIVNEPYGKGWTPVMIATWNGHAATVKALLAHKAQVEARTEDGLTALMMAACKKHEAIALLLLEQGANAGALDEHGKSVLMWAAQSGSVPIAQLILARKVDTKARNNKGLSALDYAMRESHAEMIALLQKSGA